MRAAGIAGVRRGKRVRTTKPDPGAPRHPDLVGRDFTATAPNQLWVTDLTFVPTWAGVAYVCFITDAYSRMIVGWRVAPHMRTTMVLDAIEMARWSTGNHVAGLAMSLRCRIAIHLHPVRRTSRRDRCGALDRDRRRQLRQGLGFIVHLLGWVGWELVFSAGCLVVVVRRGSPGMGGW